MPKKRGVKSKAEIDRETARRLRNERFPFTMEQARRLSEYLASQVCIEYNFAFKDTARADSRQQLFPYYVDLFFSGTGKHRWPLHKNHWNNRHDVIRRLLVMTEPTRRTGRLDTGIWHKRFSSRGLLSRPEAASAKNPKWEIAGIEDDDKTVIYAKGRELPEMRAARFVNSKICSDLARWLQMGLNIDLNTGNDFWCGLVGAMALEAARKNLDITIEEKRLSNNMLQGIEWLKEIRIRGTTCSDKQWEYDDALTALATLAAYLISRTHIGASLEVPHISVCRNPECESGPCWVVQSDRKKTHMDFDRGQPSRPEWCPSCEESAKRLIQKDYRGRLKTHS